MKKIKGKIPDFILRAQWKDEDGTYHYICSSSDTENGRDIYLKLCKMFGLPGPSNLEDEGL